MIMPAGGHAALAHEPQRPAKQLLPLIAEPGSAKPLSLLQIAARLIGDLVRPSAAPSAPPRPSASRSKRRDPRVLDDRILGEPVGRDTVNAVGFAAAVFSKLHKDAVFCVLTADHLIRPESVFRERADLAFRMVEQDPSRLVTFAIKPTYAATGFGYVERGPALTGVTDDKRKPIGKGLAFRVTRFVEKPDAPRAQAYFESGHFAWNSGMFVFHAQTFMDCLKRFKPESHDGLMKIREAWGTKKQRDVLAQVYPELPRISVDYAVMEPASRDKDVSVCTVLTDVDWLDVGSWPSYGQTLQADGEGNRVGAQCKAVLVDAVNNLIVSDDPSHTVAVLGVKDLIVVHTKDATLVMPREKAEQLKKPHAMVEEGLR